MRSHRWGSPCILHRPNEQLYRYGTVTIACCPTSTAPRIVLPISIAKVSPDLNPVDSVSKWHTRSGKPSPLTSSPPALQNPRLCSLPVRPKVNEVVSTAVTALNDEVERIATGILPRLRVFIGGVSLPGLIERSTGTARKPRISPPPNIMVWILKYAWPLCIPARRTAAALAAVPPFAATNAGL